MALRARCWRRWESPSVWSARTPRDHRAPIASGCVRRSLNPLATRRARSIRRPPRNSAPRSIAPSPTHIRSAAKSDNSSSSARRRPPNADRSMRGWPACAPISTICRPAREEAGRTRRIDRPLQRAMRERSFSLPQSPGSSVRPAKARRSQGRAATSRGAGQTGTDDRSQHRRGARGLEGGVRARL